MKNIIVSVIMFLLSCAGAFGTDTIFLEKTIVDYEGEKGNVLEKLLSRAVLKANRIYSSYFEIVSDGGSNPDYVLQTALVGDGEDTTVSFTLKNSGTEEAISMAVIGSLLDDRVSHFSNLFFYLWSSFHRYMGDNLKAGPLLVEELSADFISQSLSTGMPMQLFPYSIAVKNNGNILIGFISMCVEMDRNFRIIGQPGKSLTEQGNYTYAFGVSVTPGGTIYLKPSAGREVYKVIEGAPKPIRVRTGVEVQGPFVGLPDGTIVIIDLMKKLATRIEGRKSTSLDLFPGTYSFITAATAGPEGNIWVFDGMERRVLIYSPDGSLLDTVIPVVDQKIPLAAFSMAVYPDGSFILFSNGELWRFRKNGMPVWRMSSIGKGTAETLPQTAFVGVDPERGLVYLTDMMGRRILKFLDTSYTRENSISNPFEEEMAALGRRIVLEPDNTDLLSQKAEVYEDKGAFELAKSYWEQVLEIDPFHQEAAERLDAIEVAILKAKASELKEKTLEILDTLGPETARQNYSLTVQQYEKIFSYDPNEQEAKQEYEDLKRRFAEKTAVPGGDRNALIIAETELDNLFPSLIHYYRDNPVGMVRVTNVSGEDLDDVKATLYIRKFMDFPADSAVVTRLPKGKDAVLDLRCLFNEQIFDLQEDLPVQARIEVTAGTGNRKFTVSINKTVTLYRRTALTWDDTGKLAAFFMPNEDTVSGFSHRVLTSGDEERWAGLPPKIRRAARISDALGAYSIHYIEDPDSPISAILGKKEIVDTVRFPRTTLYIRSGDCDDTTVLLGSLFESAGISSAIMTTPGHVFVAFDSEEPAGSKWLFSSDKLEVIPYEGTLWIPMETTALQEGFFSAWETGSRLVKEYAPANRMEFLPIRTVRDRYPPLPIGESSFTIAEPTRVEIENRYENSLDTLSEVLYRSGLSDLEKQLAAFSGRTALKVQNKIGILHARFGENRQAEEVFQRIISGSPEFLSPYVNLANLRLSMGRTEEAIVILEDGLDVKPDSPLLNLLLARSYHEQEQQSKASRYYARVKDLSPGLAARYSYLGDASASVGRAGIGREEKMYIWDSGE